MAAVDLDGVLCHGTGRYESRIPDRNQIERVRELKASGYKIIIWTSRKAGFESKRRTETYLRLHGVVYDRLVMGKPVFDVVIDDKAVSELPEDLDRFRRRARSSIRFRSPMSLPESIRPQEDSETLQE